MLSHINHLFVSAKNVLQRKDIYYVTEGDSWSITEDARNITGHLSRVSGYITTSIYGIPRHSVIHLGSLNVALGKKNLDRHNGQIVATCFHIVEDNPANLRIPYVNEFISRWHTSCSITKEKMIERGIEDDKISVIPIGIDLNKYSFVDSYEKRKQREMYGIPPDAIVIGSFQKDGNGSGKGMEPKLIKGPDIFCDVVEKISREANVFVLLSGPCRGYVINRLERANIPYKHMVFDRADDVAMLYHMIDVYIVASRVEGGPKAILESMASGIPIVSTKVGQAVDIVSCNENGILVDIEDVEGLVSGTMKVIDDCNLRGKLIRNGINTAKKYSLDYIAKRYEDELYLPMLRKIQ